jgi:hypothetical protein
MYTTCGAQIFVLNTSYTTHIFLLNISIVPLYGFVLITTCATHIFILKISYPWHPFVFSTSCVTHLCALDFLRCIHVWAEHFWATHTFCWIFLVLQKNVWWTLRTLHTCLCWKLSMLHTLSCWRFSLLHTPLCLTLSLLCTPSCSSTLWWDFLCNTQSSAEYFLLNKPLC